MADTRIYKVMNGAKEGEQLLRATSIANVRQHLTRKFRIEPATPDDVEMLMSKGIKVETTEASE